MASSTSFGKAFQRRLYSVLLDRSTVVAIVVLSGLIIISTLREEFDFFDSPLNK